MCRHGLKIEHIDFMGLTRTAAGFKPSDANVLHGLSRSFKKFTRVKIFRIIA